MTEQLVISIVTFNIMKSIEILSLKVTIHLVTECKQLKLKSSDGKFYKTDVAKTEQIFRLIQSIQHKQSAI